MPDAQIHPTGTVPTPADYVVPDSAELLLKGVYAKFDGSGAAGSYRPLVRIVSDAGSTVIEAVADTTIAAGASADASWFPHLAAAASSPPASRAQPFAAMSAPAAVTVPAGTTKIVDMNSLHIYTNDSSVFAIGSWVHSAVTYHGIEVLSDGHYLAKGQVIVGGFEAATSGFITALWANQPGNPASYGSGGPVLNCPVAVAFGQWDPYMEGLTTVSSGSTDIWIMQVQNSTSVAITAYLDLIAVQLDTDTTHIF